MFLLFFLILDIREMRILRIKEAAKLMFFGKDIYIFFFKYYSVNLIYFQKLSKNIFII